VDASQFDQSLGKPLESPEVTQLLKDLGVTKKLKLGPEGYTRVSLDKLGLLLAFEPAGPKTSKLVLDSVQFLGGGADGVTRYSGTLPRALEFTDSQKEVRVKLGKPTKAKKDFRMDQWIGDGRLLSVTYRKSLDEVSLILLGLPLA
jgi:hypothetical protein